MDKAALILAIGTLGSKAVEFLKHLTSKDWNATFTLIVVWASGVAVTVLAAAAKVTENFAVPGTDQTLGSLDGPSIVLLGMSLLSFVAYVYDFKKALDEGDSAKQPPLVK